MAPLLDKEVTTSLWSSAARVGFRLLIPFLLGGITFKFGFGDKEYLLSIKAEVAALRQELRSLNGNSPAMAGAGIPFALPTPKPSVVPSKE